MADVPMPAPETTTPDYTQQTPAAPVAPTPNTSLTNVKAAPATFGRSFRSVLGGPKYQADDQGQLTPVTAGSPSGKGLLGSVLAGAVMGALHGAAATKRGERGGVAFASGVREDQAIRDEKDQIARQTAQQNFKNKQATQQMTLEQQKAADEHNTAVLTANHMTAMTTGLIQTTQFEKEMHPLELQAKKLGMEAEASTIAKNTQEIEKNNFDMAQNLASMGIDPTAVINSWSDAKNYTGQIVAGTHAPLPNGLPSDHDNFGANLYKLSDFQRPLTHDVSYTTYDSTDKEGNPIPTKHTLAADGNNTVANYVAAAMNGQSHLLQSQALLKSKISLEDQKSQETLRTAQANEANAKAGEAEANSKLLGSAGLEDSGRRLYEGDEDPMQLSKRSKDYEARIQAADDYGMKHYGKHFDMAQRQTDFKYANQKSTQDTLRMVDAITEPKGSLEIAQTAAKQLPKLSIQDLNKVFNYGSSKFGDPAVSNFHTAMIGLADEYAKVMGGGVATDAGRQQSMDILRNYYSKHQMDGAASIIKQDLNARTRGIVGDNTYLLKKYPQIPAGATMKVPDGKGIMHWSDGKNDLGVVQ